MSLRYIIDGYNLICHPLFSKIHKKTDTPAQDLLECIRNHRLTGSAKNEIIIVLDGYSSRAYQENRACGHACSVVFSREESADECIKRLIEKAANPRVLVVVSDDREIVFFAKSYHARTCSVDEFFGALQSVKAAREKSARQEDGEHKIGYTQMQEINKELREKWLK